MSTFAATGFAVSGGGAFRRNLMPGVFGDVFMPSFTMGSGLLPFGVSKTANGKTIQHAELFLGQHFFNRMPFVKTGQNCVDMNAKTFRPLPSRQCHVIFGDSDVRFPIVGLLFARCPTAIFWAIRPIVINAIKRCAEWPFAHISNKIRERHPPFTNVNASSPISFICRVFRIKTTLFSRLPYSVQIGLGLAMTTLHGVSVLQWSEKVK